MLHYGHKILNYIQKASKQTIVINVRNISQILFISTYWNFNDTWTRTVLIPTWPLVTET